MAQKDLHHRLTGDASSLEGAMRRGASATTALEREQRKLERQQRRVHQAMDQVGRGMLLAGAAIAAGLALSVKAAVEWESAWAGVLKTVDGSPEQMAALEEEIRGLTAVLPATHSEIAAVAEAAGQLGIQRENIAAFTKTMIDMGEATNLSSDQAATSIARLMNIMQTAPGDVERLASSIVDLGNKGATTEAEITEMALRIAGAGQTIGLSEQQVLAFAAALSNVGIRAEAGGTAISKVFLEIDTAVSAGGDNLETFAETAGMTADEFRQAYERDAGAAIAAFVAGLARVQESGGDVNAILTELGITEIRTSDALRRLAGSGDTLAETLQISSAAWEENSALVQEAERRYGTTAAQLSIARNQVNDLAIDMGSTLLPILGTTADAIATVAASIGSLPGPVKTALGLLALFTAALLVTGGATLLLVPRLVAARAALTALGVSMRTATLSMGAVGVALSIAAAAIAAFAAKSAEAKQQTRELSAEIDVNTGLLTDNGAAMRARNLLADDDVKWLLKRGLAEADLIAAIEGDTAAEERAAAQLREGSRLREDRFRRIVAEQKALMGSAQAEAAAAAALGDHSAAERDAADAAGVAAGGLTEMGEAAGDAEAQVRDLEESLRDLFGQLFDVEEAQDAAAEALRRVTTAAAEQGTKLDGNSESALNNRDNIRNLIKADFDLVTAMSNAGASADDLVDKTEQLKQKFIDQMIQAGFSEEAVEEYAEAYDQIPSEVSTNIQVHMTEAERRLRNIKASIDAIPRSIDVNVDVHQAGTAPIGSQRIGHQHGGEIHGPPGPDRVPIMATAGEIMIREPVAQANRAALLAFNATGRFPVGGGGIGGGSGMAAGGAFTGELFLDSGEFLGVVRGQVRGAIGEHDRALTRRIEAGVGAAR